METLEEKTISLERDVDGYLKNLHDWNENVAVELACEEGIELNERHWVVINFMREVFNEKEIAPSIRKLTKESGVKVKELYELFPKGPVKRAAKIAGIPKPKGCI
jgi:dissimilatory sulfite reductase related protein